MVIISLLGCLYVFKINEVNISGSSYQVTLPIKFTIFVIIAAMLTILFIFIRYYKNKLKEKDLCLFHLSILSVVAIELTVTMFLTPYWLQTMYGIPFFASQFVRILKSCVMIPVGIIIVYTMNRMIQKLLDKVLDIVQSFYFVPKIKDQINKENLIIFDKFIAKITKRAICCI